MALGRTTYDWRPDVHRRVLDVLARFPSVTANTYINHPFPGWDDRSVDFWGPGGRGDAIDRATGAKIQNYLLGLTEGPAIRHTIYLHRWWTNWAGWLKWNADDHSGQLRHVHVTYL